MHAMAALVSMIEKQPQANLCHFAQEATNTRWKIRGKAPPAFEENGRFVLSSGYHYTVAISGMCVHVGRHACVWRGGSRMGGGLKVGTVRLLGCQEKPPHGVSGGVYMWLLLA